MTQQIDDNTAPASSPGDESALATATADAPDTPSPKKQGTGLLKDGLLKNGFLKTVLWSGAFVVTAIASTTVGLVLGLTIPVLDRAPEEEQTDSIAELWRKGVRHQLVRPVNILVMGIDQVPASDLSESPDAESDGTTTIHPESEAGDTVDLPSADASSADASSANASSANASSPDASSPDLPSTLSVDSEQTVELERLAGRSDAMLLVQLNPEESTVNVLSIPRDTQVQFPSEVGVTKINHANLVGGPRLAAEVVSHNLGGVEIDRYVRISTAAFRELVDAVGGVEVTVPTPMKYTDQTQGLYIDLEAGKQVLMGDEAEQFARFRGDVFGDIGRVQRQQQLLGALRDRLMSPNILPRIPGIVQLLRAHIDTNLTPEELLAILNFSLDMERDDFRMVMLPGTFSQDEYLASYWLMDRPVVNQVLTDYFHISPSQLAEQAAREEQSDQPVANSDAQANSSAQNNGNAPNNSDGQDDSDGNEESDRALKSLRIAVQNASSDPTATGQIIRYLQAEGFTQVYRVSSLTETQLDTQIIVQRGNLRGAALVEQILGQGDVVSASTGDLASDLTVRIGNDWQIPEADEE